jgi:hypothetical protein
VAPTGKKLDLDNSMELGIFDLTEQLPTLEIRQESPIYLLNSTSYINAFFATEFKTW